MKCPFCGEEAIKGKLFGGRYSLKWITSDNFFIKYTPFVGEKIRNENKKEKTSIPHAICYKCTKCAKLIIDY